MDVDQAGPSTGQAENDKGKAKAKPGVKNFELKKWDAVAMWSWAITTDTCAICRNNLYEPSIEYQVGILWPCCRRTLNTVRLKTSYDMWN